MKLVLQRAGFDTLLCSDTENLHFLLGHYQPRLVVLDVVLPGANGLNLVREMKATEQPSAPIVVLISSLAFPEIVTQARTAGADEFFVKPIDSELFYQRVMYPLKKVLSANREKPE